MACKCIDETIKDLKENLPKKNESWKNKQITDATFENACWLLDETGTMLYSPIKIEYDYTNKKGQIKHKKEEINLTYTYCPYCGKKYKEV